MGTVGIRRQKSNCDAVVPATQNLLNLKTKSLPFPIDDIVTEVFGLSPSFSRLGYPELSLARP